MRIGILTFHRAINYGAFLQALALKTYLESLENKVYIIDYWPEAHDSTYKLWNTKCWKRFSFIRKLKYLLVYIIRYKRAKSRKMKMEHLLSYYLNIYDKPKYQLPKSLVELDYDCIIYGSDQIWWNSRILYYEGFDSVYWGEYIPNTIKKVAYAPSMGIINLTNEDRVKIKQWLCNFDKLSVRESQLYEAIHDLTKKEISVVLDPVFLLSKEEWEKYCIPIDKPKYILYYNLIQSKEADKLVNTLKNEKRCDVVEITGAVSPFKIGRRYVQKADAIEFISLIKSAEFVITSSFHGTAFSILFEKQFYAIGMGNRSGRVKSLLSSLMLERRLLDEFLNQSKDINYEVVTPQLNVGVQNSKSYLRNVLY